MHTAHSPLANLTPGQRQALYDQARREALALRRQALSDAADTIGRASRATARRFSAVFQGAVHWGGAAKAAPCPR